MKIVIVGCTHAGTAAVVNLKELHPESEITIYEKNDNLSFLSCGIALNVGGVIKETKNLFYNSPENLAKMGVVTNMKHEVLNIDFENKTLKVKNLLNNEEFEDNYDKLVLTLGSWPIVPKFEGGDLDNILLCKNHDHAIEIIEKSKNAKNVVIIGAGYIGVELVEAFEMQGKNVTLIDAEERIMAKYLDKEFTDIAEKALARFEIYPARARAMALRGRCLYLHYPELGILYLRHDAGLHPPGQPGLFHQSHRPRLLWRTPLPRTAAAGPETVRRRCRSRPVRRRPLAVILHLPDLGDV